MFSPAIINLKYKTEFDYQIENNEVFENKHNYFNQIIAIKYCVENSIFHIRR